MEKRPNLLINEVRVFKVGIILKSRSPYLLDNRFEVDNSRGPKNGAFGKPCLCPAKKRGFWTKTAKMTNLRSNQLNGGVLLLKPRGTTKMTKMAGVTRANSWFTKGTVFCSLKQ